MPLYRHFRSIRPEPSNRLFWQWPNLDCVTVALMAMFIMLYCISLQFRLRKLQAPKAARADAHPA